MMACVHHIITTTLSSSTTIAYCRIINVCSASGGVFAEIGISSTYNLDVCADVCVYSGKC